MAAAVTCTGFWMLLLQYHISSFRRASSVYHLFLLFTYCLVQKPEEKEIQRRILRYIVLNQIYLLGTRH